MLLTPDATPAIVDDNHFVGHSISTGEVDVPFEFLPTIMALLESFEPAFHIRNRALQGLSGSLYSIPQSRHQLGHVKTLIESGGDIFSMQPRLIFRSSKRLFLLAVQI
ncbi:MAG: hypothetical protein M1816_001177 [Peltula sp. TS41687]|nr:MAG: hypothetical protein M1816_001177 [Peltula sp. TS41687]